ncbi:MAG: hypothetical protein WC829_22795, partial [Hyphomicrobium sp.]
ALLQYYFGNTRDQMACFPPFCRVFSSMCLRFTAPVAMRGSNVLLVVACIGGRIAHVVSQLRPPRRQVSSFFTSS